jgi:nicotinamidase-related amidase
VKEIVTNVMRRRKKMIEGNAALLVIDIQGGSVDLINQEVLLAGLSLEGYVDIIPKAKTLIDACRGAGIPVVYTQEFHRESLVDFGRETDGNEGIHCLEGTPGVEIVAEIAPQAGEYVLRKTRYDCFFQTGLDWYLNGIGVLPGDTLIIIGAMTNVCVHYGTVGAHQRDYHVRVVEECVAGSTRKAHEAALEQIEYLQTGARANLADVLEAVREYVPIRPQNPGAFSGLTPELAH